MTPKFQFTVILLRPDYIADDYGRDIYITHIEVPEHNVKQAVEAAKKEAWEIDNSGPNGLDEDPAGDPADYHCLVVYEGHLSACYGD